MKRIIQFFMLINAVLYYSQSIKLNINLSTNNKIYIIISSETKLTLKENLLYANDWMYQVNTLGIAKNQLTLFLYDEKNKLIESEVASRPLGKYDITSEEYDKLIKINDKKKRNARIIISSNQSKKLNLDLRIFNNIEDVFKIYPCKIFNCWYDYYTLEKGKKYKIQIQLKVKSKVYKSNIIEFDY